MPVDIADTFGQPAAAPPKPAVPESVPDEKGMDIGKYFESLPKPPTTRERIEKAATTVKGAVAPAVSKLADINRALSEETQEQRFGLKPMAEAFMGAYNDFIQQGKNYKKGQATMETLAQGAHQLGDIMTMAGGEVFAPFQQSVVEPLKQKIRDLGELISKAGSPDEARAKGIDWKIHKSDITNAVNFIADAGEAAMWAATGGEGASEGAVARAGTRTALQGVKEALGTVGKAEAKPTVAAITAALDKTMGFGKVADKVGKELQALPAGTATTAGDVIDRMIPHAEGYAKSFLEKLGENVDRKVPVLIKQQAGSDPRLKGVWKAETGHIELKAGADDIIHTSVHEIVHSATVRMMDHFLEEDMDAMRAEVGRDLTHAEMIKVIKNPSSPIMKELDAIIAEAGIRQKKAGLDFYAIRGGRASAEKYGARSATAFNLMSPRREFLAELFSNPHFQAFLADSEKYASVGYKWKNMLNQFTQLIGQHLGMKGQELKLLSQSMRVGTQLIKLQSEAKLAPKGLAQIIGKSPESKMEVIGRLGDETITRGDIDRATEPEIGRLISGPGVRAAKSTLKVSMEQLIRTFNPEALGYNAKLAASVIASRLTELEQSTAKWHFGSETRSKFWRARPDLIQEFRDKFETGQSFSDVALEKMRRKYKDWGHEVYVHDQGRGYKYEERENYLFHSFEDKEGVANYFNELYGSKWGDPNFTKERSFDLYKEAINAGFRPRFDNPEDIMLARQHASDIADMHAGILEDLASFGLATRKIATREEFTQMIDEEGKVTWKVDRIEGTKQPENTTRWRSPNGDIFWVDNQAHAVLSNAFLSKSLWADKGIGGAAFRTGMAMKNAIIPIRLAFSLFHPLHVMGIDIAAGMVRAEAELLSGKINPITFAGKMLKSGLNPLVEAANIPLGAVGINRGGWRVIKAWKGKIPASELTAADAEGLKALVETGVSPEMSSQYRTNARQNFSYAMQDMMASLRQGKVGGAAGDLTRATWHLPWAFISAMSKPVFEQWIPALKAASAIKDAKSLLERNPELIENDAARRLAMRRIGKSIDNRYGEMAYNKLFWKRWMKDLSVLNTLSLGWQLGFLREYGGGMMDLGQFAKGGEKLSRIRKGDLDKVLFVSNYTALGMGMSGLMTYAFTGEFPTGMDYINPRTGEKNPDGTDQRITTMFYSREFASLFKHMQNEGAAQGVSDLVLNKGSGMVGLVHEMWSGTNQFGQEFRDPSSDLWQKTEQSVAYALADLEPISARSIQENSQGEAEGLLDKTGRVATEAVTTKGGALSVLGFNPEPKYMSETPTQAHIKQAFRDYVLPKKVPYDQMEYSEDYTKLRRAYQTGSEKYGEMLDKISDKFSLSGNDQRRLIRSLNSPLTPEVRMFSRLRWTEQVKLLDKMTPEEVETYLPHSNKEHVRNRWIPPEQRGEGQ